VTCGGVAVLVSHRRIFFHHCYILARDLLKGLLRAGSFGGALAASSSERPVGSAGKTGLQIYETDEAQGP